MDKKRVRQIVTEQKRRLSPEAIESASLRLARRLFDTDQYQSARTLYAYMSYNQEVDTRPVIERAWRDGKRVAVPKVVGKRMLFRQIDGFEGLTSGAYGIPEPSDDAPLAVDREALVLMPGLAFDREGRRVGYGGGYYDRFLAEEPDHPRVALCFGFQLFDRLEVEAHDIRAQLVIADEPPA